MLHLIFSWSTFFSWLIFLGDLGLIGYLTYRAYTDADTLDRYVTYYLESDFADQSLFRCEVPILGPLASKILDDE